MKAHQRLLDCAFEHDAAMRIVRDTLDQCHSMLLSGCNFRMVLRGEKCSVEIVRAPTSPSGWGVNLLTTSPSEPDQSKSSEGFKAVPNNHWESASLIDQLRVARDIESLLKAKADLIAERTMLVKESCTIFTSVVQLGDRS